MIVNHKKSKSDIDIYNVSDGSGVSERGWGGAMSKKLFVIFSKEVTGRLKKPLIKFFSCYYI